MVGHNASWEPKSTAKLRERYRAYRNELSMQVNCAAGSRVQHNEHLGWDQASKSACLLSLICLLVHALCQCYMAEGDFAPSPNSVRALMYGPRLISCKVYVRLPQKIGPVLFTCTPAISVLLFSF